MRQKGNLVAFATLASAIAVSILLVLATKDRILEYWRIRQLESGSRETTLAAARWLGEKKCARAVRPLLRAMERAGREWFPGADSDGARVALLMIGLAGITPENVPDKLPRGYEHLEILRAFHGIGTAALPDLLRALLEEDDELTTQLASNLLILILSRNSSFGVWVHCGPRPTVEVLPSLERLRDNSSADPEARRLAVAVIAKLGPNQLDVTDGAPPPRRP